MRLCTLAFTLTPYDSNGFIVTGSVWDRLLPRQPSLPLMLLFQMMVAIGGIRPNFGVESTTRDALQHGYNVVIAEDACSSIGEGSHEFAITRTLPRVSRIRKSDTILAGDFYASGLYYF